MLDKNDLQAIAELIAASEERVKAYVNEKVDEKVTDETNRSIAFTEAVVEKNMALIKEGLDLALETRIPVERVERVEEDVIVLKSVVRSHSDEIERLKKAQ